MLGKVWHYVVEVITFWPEAEWQTMLHLCPGIMGACFGPVRFSFALISSLFYASTSYQCLEETDKFSCGNVSILLCETK